MPHRIAIAGLGSAADQLHLPALAQVAGATLVGAADPSPDRRRWAAGRGVPALYDDVASLLDRERPDVLIVGTPPETHRAICEQALAAGCHVFCEKPIAPSIADADAIIAAARSAGRFVAVDNQYRHLAFYRKARAAIDAGTFGRPYLLQMWQQMDVPDDAYPAWKSNLSRLVLYEFGTHALDLIAYLFGGPIGPTGGEAHPTAITTRLPQPGGGVDLVSVSRLDFPNEAIATMTLNWRSRAPQRYLEVRLDCERASLRFSLGGVARARIGWNTGVPELQLSVARGGEVRVEQGGRSRVLAQERQAGWVTATANHLTQFLAAIDEGHEPEGSASHARELLRTALAAYDSADLSGRRVVMAGR